MNKKVSKKTVVITVITIIILAILYFLFFVVDIINYIKNYEYLQEAGKEANELRNEIETFNKEKTQHQTEYREKVNAYEEILNELN